MAVMLNALRALTPGNNGRRRRLAAPAADRLVEEHNVLEASLARLQIIADALDTATGGEAVVLISEADRLVGRHVVPHEKSDEGDIYPRLLHFLAGRPRAGCDEPGAP